MNTSPFQSAESSRDPALVCRVPSGLVFLCDMQFLRGYSILQAGPQVASINGPYLQNVSISSDQDYYRLELLDLLKAIETGGDMRTPMREGALSLELALAATRSAESAAVVKL